MDNKTQPDLWFLYRKMYYSRCFEQAVVRLWQEGMISGEMHLGVGEEAIAAGVVDHLQDGDAMALDHRGTPPLLMCGVDPILLLREFVGRADGLCAGMGGHMHLFAPQHLAASSGIVGASGPAAAGFALSAQMLRPDKLAVAFFGEGAMNQGMLMEAMNLAAVWKLPTLFVCKDDGWAITTQSASVTAGNLSDRARSLGLLAKDVDGSDVNAVWLAAREAVEHVRSQRGPAFLRAYCAHLEGHFLGDQLVRVARHPVSEMSQITGPLLRSVTRKRGASRRERADALALVLSSIKEAIKRDSTTQDDPIQRTRQELASQEARLGDLEQQVEREIEQTVASALAATEPGEEVGP
jgi:TPP-dependent pyruvate/acetoin dehydrogenase alpha subunit